MGTEQQLAKWQKVHVAKINKVIVSFHNKGK